MNPNTDNGDEYERKPVAKRQAGTVERTHYVAGSI